MKFTVKEGDELKTKVGMVSRVMGSKEARRLGLSMNSKRSGRWLLIRELLTGRIYPKQHATCKKYVQEKEECSSADH